MLKVPVFWKQFVEWGTKWLNKLNLNPYLKTEVIIGGLLFLLCVVNIIIVTATLKDSELKVASTVVETVSADLLLQAEGDAGPTVTTDALIEKLNDIRERNLIVVAITSFIFTLLFGYIIAKTALAPTRYALAAEKQFIGNIAHELRTPLSIIRANSEIMLFEIGDDPDMVSILKGNIEELDRLSGIINNLLTLNTFRHVEEMHFQSLDLSTVLTDATEKFRELARNKSITIHDENVKGPLTVWGNKSGIAQVAMNLIKNAIVYTPHGGKVTISARAISNQSVMFEISDTGIGIERSKLQYIFEPFYQVESSRYNPMGSSGLGLTIVRELVKLHHGKLSIQSTPNVGTTIRVELPIMQKQVETKPKTFIPRLIDEVSIDFSKKGG